MGSLHVATDSEQHEDETLGVNDVVFTATQEVVEFNAINPQTMWVGTLTLGSVDLPVAFAQRGAFYREANLWHYRGRTVFPALQAQLVNGVADLPDGPIVSNSLPIWLTQNQVWPVYPSFLVPDNVPPPYVVAHVDRTRALGAFPILGTRGAAIPGSGTAPLYQWPSSQLLCDDVRLTTYGLNAQQATQFLMSLMDYSLDTDGFGFMNSPAFLDDKRVQPEITAIAMKKTCDIAASYYLDVADAVARRYILAASATLNIPT